MFCNKCGTKLPKGAEFCHKCGMAAMLGDEFELITDNEEPKTKKTKSKALRKVLIAVSIVFILAAGVFSLFYFDILILGNNNPGIHAEDTAHEIAVQTTNTPIKTPKPKPTPASANSYDIVNARSSDFLGEWVLKGEKENIEDDISSVSKDFVYIIINEESLKYGAYQERFKYHTGPYSYLYMYNESGGINDFSYFLSEDETQGYMIDNEGYLILADRSESGEFNSSLSVYERVETGYVEGHLNSLNKSLYWQYQYNAFPHEGIHSYQGIFQYKFVGFADNPYIDTPFAENIMMEFAGEVKDIWTSYFKLDIYNEVLDYYSTTLGHITRPYQMSSADGLGGQYYDAPGEASSLYLFISLDNRLYMVADVDGEMLSHFYVYEEYSPDGFDDMINKDVTIEDFYGVWKTDGLYYSKEGYEGILEDNYLDIYSIDESSIEYHKNAFDANPWENTDYVQNFYQDHYIALYTLNSFDSYNHLLFITNDGRMVKVIYRLKEQESYLIYQFYDRFDGTKDECRESLQ